jgi:hypothetical protein
VHKSAPAKLDGLPQVEKALHDSLVVDLGRPRLPVSAQPLQQRAQLGNLLQQRRLLQVHLGRLPGSAGCRLFVDATEPDAQRAQQKNARR